MESNKTNKTTTVTKPKKPGHTKSNSNVEEFAFMNNEKLLNNNIPNYVNNLDGKNNNLIFKPIIIITNLLLIINYY